MEAGIVNQFGDKSIYVGRNEGEIYVGMNYVEEPSTAFNKDARGQVSDMNDG